MASDRANGPQSGFTLLEMLVALSVISIAALTLLRLDAFAVRTAGDLDESTIAGIVAQNRAVELWTAAAPPWTKAKPVDEPTNAGTASPAGPRVDRWTACARSFAMTARSRLTPPIAFNRVCTASCVSTLLRSRPTPIAAIAANSESATSISMRVKPRC